MSDWDENETTELMAALASGTFVAERFRVERVLGTGSMGRVLAALDCSTQERVALKLLHRERTRDPEAMERFRREAEILSNLGHPGIVRVFESGIEPSGTPWLSMELLEGETLQERMLAGSLSLEEIARIIDVLGDAMFAAHASGVVHRDLKPDNVFLLSTGELPCKVLDFGLSRFGPTATMTRTGAVIGTPRYMAPEQIRSATRADHRVDIFALGVIAYEMLTRSSPYPAEDMGQLLGAVLGGAIVPLRERRTDLPPEVDRIVSRAMALDPDARFDSAREFARALSNALEGGGRKNAQLGHSASLAPGIRASWQAPSSFTRPSSTPSPQPEALPVRKPPRRFWWAALLVMIAAAALGVIARLWLPR